MKNNYLAFIFCLLASPVFAQTINFADNDFLDTLLFYGGYDSNQQWIDIDANNDDQIQAGGRRRSGQY